MTTIIALKKVNSDRHTVSAYTFMLHMKSHLCPKNYSYQSKNKYRIPINGQV